MVGLMTNLGSTAITIAAWLLAGNLLEHEWQSHEQRHGPIDRDVLTHNLGRICTREYPGFLIVDHMDVANVRGSHG